MREFSVGRELLRFMFLHPGRLAEPSKVVKPRTKWPEECDIRAGDDSLVGTAGEAK